VHLPIEEVSRLDEPLLPTANAKAFINQCGVVVRDTIPTTVWEWNKPKADELVLPPTVAKRIFGNR
jgi:hypothetical protein